MKYRKLMLTSLSLSMLAAVLYLCAPAICQTAGLIPTGNCSLPAGQYMLTNMRTGQAVYVEIDAGGRMLAQDPRALNFAVTSTSTTYGFNQQTNPATTGGLMSPDGTTADPNKGSMWGGLLRQGVQQIMNNRNAPGGLPLGQQ